MDEVSCQEEAAGVLVARSRVPGPVDTERSRVIRPARMPGWDGINVAEAVTEQRGCPALIETTRACGEPSANLYGVAFRA